MKASPNINGTTINVVRDHCGPQVAGLLIDKFGGSIVFIPHKPSPTSRLAKAFDPDDLRRLCAALGGEKIVVPIGRHSALRKMRDRVEKLLLEGRSASDIARTAECCIRTVYGIKAEMRASGELPRLAS